MSDLPHIHGASQTAPMRLNLNHISLPLHLFPHCQVSMSRPSHLAPPSDTSSYMQPVTAKDGTTLPKPSTPQRSGTPSGPSSPATEK